MKNRTRRTTRCPGRTPGWPRWLGAAALVVLLIAAACMPRLREPDVRLVGVRLGGLGLRGGVVHVELGVNNPNTFALEAEGLSYDLELRDPEADDEWIDLAEGTFEQDFGVGAEDSARVEIPIEFRYGGVGDVIRSLLSTGTVSYRVRGMITLDEPFRTDVPYRKTGIIGVDGSR